MSIHECVREHVLYVVAGFEIGDGLDEDGALHGLFQRLSPDARTDGTCVVGSAGKREATVEVLAKHVQVGGAQCNVGVGIDEWLSLEFFEIELADEPLGGFRHNLHEPLSANAGTYAGHEAGFLTNEAVDPGVGKTVTGAHRRDELLVRRGIEQLGFKEVLAGLLSRVDHAVEETLLLRKCCGGIELPGLLIA